MAANRDLRNLQAPQAKLKNTTTTVHIELDISNANVTYRTADNLGVFPKNDTTLVERIAQRLRVDLDSRILLRLKDESSKFACSVLVHSLILL